MWAVARAGPAPFMAPCRCVEALFRATTRGGPVPFGKVCSRKAFKSSLFRDRSAHTQVRGVVGGARCSLGGQHVDALPLCVLVPDARPLSGQGPGGGHGQGQGKTRCVQKEELEGPVPGLFLSACNSAWTCATRCGSCRCCRLAWLDEAVPWSGVEARIQPFNHQRQQDGQPYQLAVMLRKNVFQATHNLSDPMMEETLLDSHAGRWFAGVELRLLMAKGSAQY